MDGLPLAVHISATNFGGGRYFKEFLVDEKLQLSSDILQAAMKPQQPGDIMRELWLIKI